MGRLVKNRELRSGSYSIRMPVGSNAVGPNSPVDGLMRYNADINKIEFYTELRWTRLVTGDPLGAVKDTYYGDGVTRMFGPMLLSYLPGKEMQILVFVGNVFQNPGVVFTVDGFMIEFSAPPDDQQPIVILHGYANIAAEL